MLAVLLAMILNAGATRGRVALFVGAVNVKDYFAYKSGLSFTIPDRFKPRIYRGGRAVRAADRPLAALVGTTVAMAAGISLVERPCTAGFPVIWSGIMHTEGIDGVNFAGLLGLYLLIYVGLEVTLLVAVLVTLKIGRFEEHYGRMLKLLGGMVMLAHGGVLLLAPELMADLAGATQTIVGAVVLAVVIDLVNRRRHARRRSGATRGGRR